MIYSIVSYDAASIPSYPLQQFPYDLRNGDFATSPRRTRSRRGAGPQLLDGLPWHVADTRQDLLLDQEVPWREMAIQIGVPGGEDLMMIRLINGMG